MRKRNLSKFRGEIYEGLLKQIDAGSKSAADKLFTELSNEAATELAQIMTKDLAEENGEKLVDDCYPCAYRYRINLRSDRSTGTADRRFEHRFCAGYLYGQCRRCVG